jgi:hypothetical protein
MLLRASGEVAGRAVDPQAVVAGESAAGSSGVAHAQELCAFTDALVGDDDAALAAARARLAQAIGPAALVDAAAVAANFERMVRIADATGIPLDAPMVALTEDLRAGLGVGRYRSAANTPAAGAATRWLGRLLAPVAGLAFRAVARGRRG